MRPTTSWGQRGCDPQCGGGNWRLRLPRPQWHNVHQRKAPAVYPAPRGTTQVTSPPRPSQTTTIRSCVQTHLGADCSLLWHCHIRLYDELDGDSMASDRLTWTFLLSNPGSGRRPASFAAASPAPPPTRPTSPSPPSSPGSSRRPRSLAVAHPRPADRIPQASPGPRPLPPPLLSPLSCSPFRVLSWLFSWSPLDSVAKYVGGLT
jgi:hypothetical protein